MSRWLLMAVLFGACFMNSEAYGQRSWSFQRVDARGDTNPDLALDVRSAINLIPTPILDRESDAVDELIYAATDADYEEDGAFSHAVSIGEALCWSPLDFWDILGEVDLTADVDIYAGPGSGPTYMGVPSWGLQIVGEADFVIETDIEVDPAEVLTLEGSFFVLASGYTTDPSVSFADNNSIGTVIITEINTPAQSRRFRAVYDGRDWAWTVTDEFLEVIDSGDGGGINELTMFELDVLQGDLIEIRTSIIGGAAFPQVSDAGRDKWAFSATAWFDVISP